MCICMYYYIMYAVITDAVSKPYYLLKSEGLIYITHSYTCFIVFFGILVVVNSQLPTVNSEVTKDAGTYIHT